MVNVRKSLSLLYNIFFPFSYRSEFTKVIHQDIMTFSSYYLQIIYFYLVKLNLSLIYNLEMWVFTNMIRVNKLEAKMENDKYIGRSIKKE